MTTTEDQVVEVGLRKNSIAVPGAMAIGIAIMAPAAGMAFLPQVIAQYVGIAVPFTYLVGTIAVLCIAYTISVFARKFSSAGSFYTFNARGLGPGWGFMSGWLIFVGYLVFFPQNLEAFAYSFDQVLRTHGGVSIPWWLVAAVGVLVILGLAGWGIRSSMRVDLTLISLEVLVLLGLAIVIVVVGGHSGNTLAVFVPSKPVGGFAGIGFGMIFAFDTLTGFEATATVAEETRNPKRNIPRALMGAVAGTGVFFVFISYAITIGFGVNGGKRLASTGLPLDVLARHYLGGSYATVVDIAVTLSAFAVALACANGAVRVVFAMAREGVFPRRLRLGYIHPVRRTPLVAVIAVCAAALALSVGVGLAVGPYPQAYSYLGAFGALPVIFLYGLVSVSLISYFVKTRDPEFNVIKHVVIPSVGVLVTLPVLFTSFYPLPSAPFIIVDGVLVGYTLVGVGIMVHLRRHNPEVMARVGEVMAVGD